MVWAVAPLVLLTASAKVLVTAVGLPSVPTVPISLPELSNLAVPMSCGAAPLAPAHTSQLPVVVDFTK